MGNLIAKEAVQKATQSTDAGSSLIAYVVPTGKPTLTTLREHLAERIPTAAIPKKFIAVDSLPRNTNGKIDYQALSGIENGSEIRDKGYEAPKSETERVVSQIWESTLQVKRIGRTDHFFSLGGDSLKAMQVINRLREYSQGTLKITDLLKHPTLKDFCQTLESSQLKIPSEPKGHWSDFDTGSTIQFPLTPSQKGLWFLWKMDPDSPYYTCQGIIHLKGRFDSDALALAWDYISQRHDILRVRFGNVSGSPLQSFSNHSESWKNGHSLEGLAPHDAIQNIRDYAKQDAQIPFNLEGDSLLRGTFFKIDDGHHALQLTMHEITVDLWEIRILMNDLAACYQQALNGQVLFLEPKGPSFRQYLQWQTSKSQDHQLLQDEHHWKTELSGELPVLDLPLDHPRSASPSYHGKTVHTLFSEDLSSRLKTLSQQEGHTLYVTLLAGFFWMLNRYSGQQDIIIGSPIAQRDQAESEHLFGFFLNMLPIRQTVDGSLSAKAFLKSVKSKVNGALEASGYPFSSMLEWTRSARDTSVSPVFQVMFNMLSYADPELDYKDFSIGYESLETGHTKYDFSLYAQEYGDQIFLQIAYQTELFDEETMERFLRNLETFYTSLTEAIDRPLRNLNSIHPTEYKLLLDMAQGSKMQAHASDSLIDLFEHQAQTHPQRTALIHNGMELSYGALSHLVNQLALNLQGIPFSHNKPIILSLRRSFHMVAGVLAAMKQGLSYTYLDPGYPEERNLNILNDVSPDIIITDQPEIFSDTQAQVMPWSDSHPPSQEQVDAIPSTSTSSSDSFCLVYTSASTGKPKGVVIMESAIRNRLEWMWEEYPFSNDEVMILQKSLSLVASTWECLGGLLQGIPTVIADHESVIDPISFSGLCSTHRVSRIYGSPSLFSGVIAQKEKDPALFQSLKLAFTSAEPITPEQVGDWNSLFDGVPLINLYGSSECSSNALQFRCSEPTASQPRVPIGRPLPNMNAYVLDDSQNLLPKGAKGELCIAGACLAKGYLDLDAETQAKFIPVDPQRFGYDRLYLTGDLARMRQDNELELLGRTDFQIQLRGFRIEPGEIENALNAIPDIRESAVQVFRSAQGETRLGACVACEPTVDESQIRKLLRSKIPDYMIPHSIVIVNNLPRTESGKIDRKSLQFEDTLESDAESLPRVDPRSLESILAHLWRQQLGKSEIGIDDNFFDVGGHSLMAARLFAEIEKISGKAFPVSILYRAPTIRGLIAFLKEDGIDRLWSTLVPMRAEGSQPPLFCVTPWDGNAIYFRSLPKYLDQDQPIYGLEPLDSTGGPRTFTSIHEMIEQYLSDLTTFYPVGPLSLCGFSGGGVIAWEMAHRLKTAGRDIKGLYFFDTSYPGHKEALEKGYSSNELRKKKINAHLQAISAKPGFRKLSYGLETIALKIRFHLSQKNSESTEAHEEEHRAMEANRKHFEEYSANKYEGKVVLLKAKERRFETILDPTMGWSAHTQHDVEVCEIPGGHNTMLLPPHDVRLCKALQFYLNTNR